MIVVHLPSSYDSLTGPALAAFRSLTRQHPAGVDVREAEPTRIEVVIVPILKGAAVRVYGDPLEVFREVTDEDPVMANERALAAVRDASADPRVRDGWAAVVARRIGGQP